MKNSDFVFADTETTGLLEPMGNRFEFQPYIFEVHLTRTDKKLKIIDEYDTLIKVPVPIPLFISRMTGVYDADLEGKPIFKKIQKHIMAIMKDTRFFVAHNATFDRNLLDIELKRNGVSDFPFPKVTICMVEQSYHLKGYRLKALELYSYLTGETFIEGQHRAGIDVEKMIINFKKLNLLKYYVD